MEANNNNKEATMNPNKKRAHTRIRPIFIAECR